MRKIFYGILFILTSLGAFFSQINYSYVPFLLVCGWGIIALLYRHYLKSIQFTIECLEDNWIEITFKQKRRLPFHVHFEAIVEHFISQESQVIRGAFFSKERVHVEKIQLSSTFCGQLVLKEFQLQIADSLQFAVITMTSQQIYRVFQLPNIIVSEIQQTNFSTAPVMGTVAGPKERFTVYMPGDSVASIHWAMSARTQSLIVRKEAFATQQNIHGLALDFNNVTTIESYDYCMSNYYSLLLQQPQTTVYVWEREWLCYELTSVEEINKLFHKLFQIPLQELYTETPPPTNTGAMPLEGGIIS